MHPIYGRGRGRGRANGYAIGGQCAHREPQLSGRITASPSGGRHWTIVTVTTATRSSETIS